MGLYNEKRCPFCGVGVASICCHGLSDDSDYWWVACDDERCGAEGPGRPTRDEAISAWNTRRGHVVAKLALKKEGSSGENS